MMVRRIASFAIAAVAFAVFAPALQYGFLLWDDDRNFLTNPFYRGLGWAQIRWDLTANIMGHWIPVTWLTFSLDYVIWGMNPFGYHLGNVLLHAATAAVFYVVAWRLLRLALTTAPPWAITAGAIVSALFFAVHPLRVESVAWITERRDALSGLFYLFTVLAYLKACAADGASRRRWLVASLGAFTLGLLSKALIMSLPLVLLILDVYPLRRARGSWRRILVEKVPYLGLAVAAAIVSVFVIAKLGLTSAVAYPPTARAAMALYSLVFYVGKTVLPLGLSPMHELPARVELTSPRFMMATLIAIGVSAVLFLVRRPWPAGLAVWLAYGLSLAPVSGIVHNGPQLVADRYSYFSCFGLALLVGAVVVFAVSSAGIARLLRAAVVLAVFGWIVGLAALTSQQLPIWRNAETLWQRAVEVDPDCAFCHGQWGALLGNRGQLGEAIAHFERVVALRPANVRHRGNLGLALLKAERPAEAAAQFERMLAAEPADAETRTRLGLALVSQGKLAEASAQFERASRDDPRNVTALMNLGLSLLDLGRPSEAVPYLERALAIDGASPVGRAGLARARAASSPGPRLP